MKRYQFIIVVIVVILVTSIVGAGASLSAAPSPYDNDDPTADGRPTFLPLPSITFLSLYVNIPDPNLDEALHQKLGKPMSQDIYYFELAGLTGTLYLNNKDISDAEGVQYCTGITSLVMDGNNLTTLPPMDIMAGLESASFQYNDFTQLPSQLCTVPNLEYINLSFNPLTTVGSSVSSAPSLKNLVLESCSLTSFPSSLTSASGLESLRLDNNDIGSIPSGISGMSSLKNLYMQNTGLSSLPSQLYSMTSIEVLQLSDNDISSLSTSISGMTHLKYLTMNNNDLESIPNEICSISSLVSIMANGNRLYSLPAGIAGTGIEQISVRMNRISHLPSNIGDASQLYLLDVMVNRLKELPGSLDDKSWDFINVEFNFIDMSPGSDSRTIIDNTTSFTKYFERQLKPIEEVIATPSDTSIMLEWTAGEDGSGGGASWTIDSYKVYLSDSYTLIEDLLPTELSYEHTGLTPETTYLYHVGVDYHVVVPSHSIDTIIRAYTDVEPTTLAEAAETPAPETQTEDPEAEPEATAEGEGEEEASQDMVEIDVTDDDSGGGFPIWAIIVICVLGGGVLATGAALIVMKVKGKSKTDFQKRA